MMANTHALTGVLLGSVLAAHSPTSSMTLVVAGFVGGLFPDLDMLMDHRRTLHFPVVFPVVGALLGLVALWSRSSFALVMFTSVGSAAIHCLMDVLGGGKEMRPWLESDERAVFNHVTGKWIRPKRLFYDGSLPDLGLAIIAGAISISILGGQFLAPLLLLVGLSIIYTGLRRVLTRWIPEDYATFSSYLREKLL